MGVGEVMRTMCGSRGRFEYDWIESRGGGGEDNSGGERRGVVVIVGVRVGDGLRMNGQRVEGGMRKTGGGRK